MILFLKFKESSETLFLDLKRECDVDREKKYTIVLSPSLYWIKKVSLPLHHVHEVKKIVATIFEDILPEGNYSYDVIKDGDAFLLFAYEDSKIKSLLEKRGIALSKVTAITFAQFVYKDRFLPCKVSQDEVLTQQDGIVLLLPCQWFDNVDDLEDKKVDTTALKHTIELQQFNHIIDKKILYKGIFVLAFFILLLGIEYITLLEQKESIEKQKEALFLKYSLKPTMMQNRAILQKYEKIDHIERNLREYLASFLDLSLKKGERIEKIYLHDKKLIVTFSGVKKTEIKALLSKFYKNRVDITTKYKAKKLEVEIAL